MKRIKQFFRDLINYLGTFPNVFSENSTKLLALLISAITGGFLVAIVIPLILIWDVAVNGYIKTDLIDLGIFLLCVGGYVFGAGATIKVPDLENLNKESKRHRRLKEEVEDTCEGEDE